MQRFDLYLTDVQIEKLKMISKETGLTVAEMIRRGVDGWVEKYQMKGRKLATKREIGTKDKGRR
jgi:hypothetical protein